MLGHKRKHENSFFFQDSFPEVIWITYEVLKLSNSKNTKKMDLKSPKRSINIYLGKQNPRLELYTSNGEGT